MKNNTTVPLEFTPISRKKVTALFDEPSVSSDAGVLLLREVDQRIGLTDRIVSAVSDPRRPTHIRHQMHEMIRQRSYQIACGYKDAVGEDIDFVRLGPDNIV